MYKILVEETLVSSIETYSVRQLPAPAVGSTKPVAELQGREGAYTYVHTPLTNGTSHRAFCRKCVFVPAIRLSSVDCGQD